MRSKMDGWMPQCLGIALLSLALGTAQAQPATAAKPKVADRKSVV